MCRTLTRVTNTSSVAFSNAESHKFQQRHVRSAACCMQHFNCSRSMMKLVLLALVLCACPTPVCPESLDGHAAAQLPTIATGSADMVNHSGNDSDSVNAPAPSERRRCLPLRGGGSCLVIFVITVPMLYHLRHSDPGIMPSCALL